MQSKYAMSAINSMRRTIEIDATDTDLVEQQIRKIFDLVRDVPVTPGDALSAISTDWVIEGLANHPVTSAVTMVAKVSQTLILVDEPRNVRVITITGLPHDVAAATYLFDLLLATSEDHWQEFLNSPDYSTPESRSEATMIRPRHLRQTIDLFSKPFADMADDRVYQEALDTDALRSRIAKRMAIDALIGPMLKQAREDKRAAKKVAVPQVTA